MFVTIRNMFRFQLNKRTIFRLPRNENIPNLLLKNSTIPQVATRGTFVACPHLFQVDKTSKIMDCLNKVRK